MQILKESLICLLIALLCGFALGGNALVWRAPKMMNQQVDATRASLQAEAHIAIVDMDHQLASALDLLDHRTGRAFTEIHLLGQNADERTSEALGIVRTFAADADSQATGLRSEVNGQMTALNNTLGLTVAPITELAHQMNDAAPLWLDCEFNPDCAFNRYQGVTKALEQTAKVIAREAPKMSNHADSVAASADTIAADITREADQLTKPQSFWGSLRTWLLTLARIYGAI